MVKTGVYRVIYYFSYFCSFVGTRYNRLGEYPQSMFWTEIWKISEFLSANFQVLVVKFSIYLNRRVFVMSGAMYMAQGTSDVWKTSDQRQCNVMTLLRHLCDVVWTSCATGVFFFLLFFFYHTALVSSYIFASLWYGLDYLTVFAYMEEWIFF